jgi:hypothetical protein
MLAGRLHQPAERFCVTKLHVCGSALLILANLCLASCLGVGGLAYGQAYYPNKEVRISDLASLTARSPSATDVLATSVEIVFHDKEVCCGKDSALQDGIQSADPTSLKDVSDKLRGRHLLSDGLPIQVAAEYLPAASVNAASLINTLTAKYAPLMEWNSHLYVVYGVTFVETFDPDTGARTDAIHKLLLWDTRFSDGHREVVFDRLSDDWGKVQGLLVLTAARH